MQEWKGHFRSEMYSMLGNSFVVGKFKFNLDIESKTRTSADVEINYTGMYRYGEVSRGKVTIDGDKIIVVVDEMNINFRISQREKKRVAGKYSISSPYDNGSFYLTCA